MTKYQPSAEEQAALELLEGRGWKVMRRRTYDRHQRFLDAARQEIFYLHREAEIRSSYADEHSADARNMRLRLERVAIAAVSEGVSMTAIKKALS